MIDLLYFDGLDLLQHNYTVLSYWTIIEILCRIHMDDIQLPVRVGARDDMDIIEKVPAVYDDHGRFHKWDFILYEAVQHFNIHGNLVVLLAEIEEAISEKCFKDWKLDLDIRVSAIEKCFGVLRKEIEQVNEHAEFKARQLFLKNVFDILDAIEYNERSLKFARKLRGRMKRISMDQIKSEVHQYFESRFRERMQNLSIRICEVHLEIGEPRLLRVHFQLRDLSKQKLLYNIWVGIPTKQG
jgi:hypothetical protein